MRDPVSERTIADTQATVIANDTIETAIAESAGAIEEINLNGDRIDDVRQRQPHGANLLPAWRQAVEDAARDDEMRLGVVMAERESCTPIHARGECAQNGGENAKATRKSVEGGHRLVL